MNLTQKETDLLKDMRDQELLCIEKYEKYSCSACSTELKNLFNSLADAERTHLKTINEMMGGTVKQVSGGLTADNCFCGCASYCDDTSKKCDEFLCKDMLASEKHVSSVYNVGIFEFTDPAARRLLNHIQAEEQQHGEQLYAYMNCNQMYS
jgi:rubrerythrin